MGPAPARGPSPGAQPGGPARGPSPGVQLGAKGLPTRGGPPQKDYEYDQQVGKHRGLARKVCVSQPEDFLSPICPYGLKSL